MTHDHVDESSNQHHHTVVAFRGEREWKLHAINLPGAIAQAASLEDAEAALRQLLIQLTGDDADAVVIDLVPIPGPGGFD